MECPIGLRFRPTEEEIFDVYLRAKNHDTDTSHVDRVISTVPIYKFKHPRELPSQSMIKLKDHVWYFYCCKENKYETGERHARTTESGYWKITGQPKPIIRNGEKIGHKRILMFYLGKTPNGTKSDWVMHEYHLLSPNQITTYTVCEVMFKGNKSELDLILSNNLGEFMSRGTEGPPQFSDFPDVDALDRLFEDILSDDFNGLLDDDDDDDEEESMIVSMDEDRSNHIPKKALTGVFSGYSSDDSDSDPISQSPTTTSIQTSSTCDSFGSSNHCIDHITDLKDSPNSTIKFVSMTQEVSKTLDKKEDLYDDVQETEFGEHKTGQDMIKNKRVGFFYRIIQRLKKTKLCSSI